MDTATWDAGAALTQLTLARAQDLDVTWDDLEWKDAARCAVETGRVDEFAAALRARDVLELTELGTGTQLTLCEDALVPRAAELLRADPDTLRALLGQTIGDDRLDAALSAALALDAAWLAASGADGTREIDAALLTLIRRAPLDRDELDRLLELGETGRMRGAWHWRALLDEPALDAALRRELIGDARWQAGQHQGLPATHWITVLTGREDLSAAERAAVIACVPAWWRTAPLTPEISGELARIAGDLSPVPLDLLANPDLREADGLSVIAAVIAGGHANAAQLAGALGRSAPASWIRAALRYHVQTVPLDTTRNRGGDRLLTLAAAAGLLDLGAA